MADTEALALINAGREKWNSFQKRRQASRVRREQGTSILDLTLADFEGRDFSGWIFDGVDFSRARLSGSNFKGSLLSAVNLTQADLHGADLSETQLQLVDFAEANLSEATLSRASSTIWVSFINAVVTNADLSYSRLDRARFDSADVSESRLVRASLAESSFSEASLRDADLQYANLARANLQGTDLRGTRFESTNLEGASIYRTIPSGLDLSGALNIPNSAPRRIIALASSPGGGGTCDYDPPDAESTAVRVPVLYVTDRAPGAGRRAYGPRQSEVLSFGTCDVSVPKFNRPMGEVPRPSLWRLEFRENLTRHVVILRVEEKSESDFYSEFTKGKGTSDRSSEVLLFVHGYNVSFEDAVRLVAQLAYDLNFPGTPVLYSWASQATLRGYPVDLANNEKTWSRLARFLCRLRDRDHPHAVHLISHSMGGRAVCHATTLLPLECPNAMVGFKNIIFAAPDVHTSSFREALPKLTSTSERVTMYFCPDDIALRASRIFHDTPRAGEMAVIAAGLDTIDASAVLTGILCHSVFGERSALSDIFELIEHGTVPGGRFGLEPVDGPDGRYFRLKQ